MNIITASSYWVIVAIWLTTVLTVGYFYFTNSRIFGTTRLLLAVVGLDAIRNLIENIYFGLYFGSKYGLFSEAIGKFLGNPYLLILPKIANIGAGCIVLGVLLWKWLPQAINERAEAERQVKYLHQLATIDHMTGLLNRREFLSQVETEWQRCQRHQRPLSLVSLDIDNFKSINDNYGHNAGDEAIILIAKLCNGAKRASDIAGRLGGEEFAILLPETKIAEAFTFAERLRTIIATETHGIIDGNVSTTVSIGLSITPEAASISEFFKQADTALYEAKRTGRNRVCCYGELQNANLSYE